MDAFNHTEIDMDVFDEISFDKIKNEFYHMAVSDLNNGASLVDLQDVVKSYEEIEWYAACAGIKQAMDEVESLRSVLTGSRILMKNIDKDE